MPQGPVISPRLAMVTGLDVVAAGLSIVGLRLVVRSDFPVEVPLFPKEYESFLDGSPGCRPSRLLGEAITVDLLPGIPSDITSGAVVTHAGPWRLFRNGARRVIVWDGADASAPLWAASLTEGANDVTVWCGEKFLVRDLHAVTLRNPFRYPLDQLALMFYLVGRGVILHAAGFSYGKGGLVAMGRSGAGKSTLSRLWMERFGRESVLSDDRVIAMAGDGPGFYGSPWPGELGAARNERAPLSAFVFLKQAQENILVPLSAAQALEQLLPVGTIPWFDGELLPAALECCQNLVSKVPAYEFHFTPTREAVEVLAGLTVVQQAS